MALKTNLLAAIAVLAIPATALAEDAQTVCPEFESIGEGPDLLLVPGLGSPPAVWDPVRDQLASEYTVHFVHVAGFAGREPSGDPDTIIDRAAQEIVTYLDCNGIESTAYAGHSMGGFLGLKIVSEHPDRLDRLVIVDSLPFFSLIYSPAATPELVKPQADQFRAQVIGQSEEEFAQSQRMGVRSLVKNAEYHETVVDWSLTSDRASFAGAMHALMTTDLRPELSGITTPTTVIAAANAFAPRSRIESLYGGAYADLQGAELTIIEDSYHFIMFDQPEAFSATLMDALEPSG